MSILKKKRKISLAIFKRFTWAKRRSGSHVPGRASLLFLLKHKPSEFSKQTWLRDILQRRYIKSPLNLHLQSRFRIMTDCDSQTNGGFMTGFYKGTIKPRWADLLRNNGALLFCFVLEQMLCSVVPTVSALQRQHDSEHFPAGYYKKRRNWRLIISSAI